VVEGEDRRWPRTDLPGIGPASFRLTKMQRASFDDSELTKQDICGRLYTKLDGG
jgi:hypothetical protein